MRKRIDGGISGARTPPFPRRRTLARAWTTGQGGFDRVIRVPTSLSRPQGAVYSSAARESRLQLIDAALCALVACVSHASSDSRRVYFTLMTGLGGSAMLGLMRNPVWGGWL
jgi:hypothetical protein